MFQRQKVMLHLIDRAGGRLDKLRLMKLAFLARQENHLTAETATYGFVPCQHGPFSFTMCRDCAKLSKEGVLAEDHASVALKDRRDIPRLEAASKVGVDAVWERYGTWNSARLLQHVYAAYPWFTLNAKDPMKRARAKPMIDVAVYTVGYEGLSFDDFLNRLLVCGIRRIVDVRANPVARRYGFHRSTLERTLAKLDIDYTHVPELGIPGEERGALESASDYERLFARYEAETLRRERSAIASITTLLCELPSALLCMEADPMQCHRSRLGKRIASETDLPMTDLREVAAT